MDIGFYMPVEIVCGKHAVKTGGKKLAGLGSRCLIITGKSGAKKSGALQEFMQVLTGENISFTIYNGIGENPLLSACQEAGDAARQFGADFIAGIGGGSVLDATKAAAIYAQNPTIQQDALYALKHEGALPFCLIGTTAGTGSEVTPIAVLTNDQTGRKGSINHPDCFAKLVFADYRYTCSTSDTVTVSTALDALCHATEGYFSPACNEICDLFAYRALELLGHLLPVLDTPKLHLTESQLEQLYIASLYAGLVLCRCGTGFPHPLGYILTEQYGLAHGRACAVFLPAYLKRSAEYAAHRLPEFEQKLGMPWWELSQLVTHLHGFSKKLPPQITDNFTERFLGNANFARSPGGLTPELAAVLFEELLV